MTCMAHDSRCSFDILLIQVDKDLGNIFAYDQQQVRICRGWALTRTDLAKDQDADAMHTRT